MVMEVFKIENRHSRMVQTLITGTRHSEAIIGIQSLHLLITTICCDMR